MFRGLRLRLTLLYLLAALALIALVAFGTYQLVDSYFQNVTSLGLQHMMAHEYRGRGLALPAALAAADRDWSTGRTGLFPGLPAAGAQPVAGDSPGAPRGLTAGPAPADGDSASAAHFGRDDDLYNGELAAIFVLAVDAQGQVVAGPATPPAPLAPDGTAVAAALTTGMDLRTVTLPSGARVRLLTYRLPAGSAPAVLQLGRSTDDQDRVLHQLLLSLLALGGVAVVLLGAGSWGLAGRALRPAQQAWARQQAFVANASHELRTPLTLLRASAEVVQRGLPPTDADGRALLNDVLQESDHMSRLVDDLLLLSRLDAGRLPVEHAAIPLAALLSDVQRQMGRVATERGVDLAVDRAQGTAWGDPTRLRQVLLILLDNALRHTPQGGQIRLAAHPAGRGVQIQVLDSGCGIAPEHLPHLFDRFYRADDARARTSGGTGLGLAIAKGLIDAQHGQIVLTSRPGTGTRVTVTLPAVGGA